MCTICGAFVPCRQHPLADVRQATPADHEAQRETRKQGDFHALDSALPNEGAGVVPPDAGAQNGTEQRSTCETCYRRLTCLPVSTCHPEAYVLVDLRGDVWMWLGRWRIADQPTMVRAAGVIRGALDGRCTCETCWPSLTADMDVDAWYPYAPHPDAGGDQ